MSQLSATNPAFTARDTVLIAHKKDLFSRTRRLSFTKLRPPQHPTGSKSFTKELFTRSRNQFPLTIYAIKPQVEKPVPTEGTKKHAHSNNVLPGIVTLGSSSLTSFQASNNGQGLRSGGQLLRRNTMSPCGGKKKHLLKKINSNNLFKPPAQRYIDKDMMKYTPQPPQSNTPTETKIPHPPQSVGPTETTTGPNNPHPPQSVRPTETNIGLNTQHPPESDRHTETNTGLTSEEYRTELQTQITNGYQIQNINRFDPLITAMEGDGFDASKPDSSSKSAKEKDIESNTKNHKASDEEESDDLKYNEWNKSRLFIKSVVTPKDILELDFSLLTSNRPAKFKNATNQLAAAVHNANDNNSKAPLKKKKILRFNVETDIVQGHDHDANSISGGSLSRMSSANDLLSSPAKSPNLGRILSVENLFFSQVSRQSSAVSEAGGWRPASHDVWEGSDELVEQWWA